MTVIFPGSFNPIHIGHLALANWICEYGGADELWFVVSPQNPLKDAAAISVDSRLRLVEDAIAGYGRFKACDVEFHLPQPNYTIQTMRALRQQYPGRDFALLIGADNWSILAQWKDSQALVDEFPILVYPRAGYDININIRRQSGGKVRALDAPLLEISSTFIRQAISEGKDVRYFLPNQQNLSFNF